MPACYRCRKDRVYKSMPVRLKPKPKRRTVPLPLINVTSCSKKISPSPNVLDSVTFSFSQQCRMSSEGSSSTSSYTTASPCSFRGSDNSVYQTPPAPKSFMDSSAHSEDLSFSLFPEADQVSLSSTASSCGYRDRRQDAGSAPLYLPMNRGSGHSPSSNSKVSVCIQTYSCICYSFLYLFISEYVKFYIIKPSTLVC